LQRHDVLVVGSGPVGIAVARRLAEQGLRVTVLESGAAVTDPPGSHLRNRPELNQNPDSYFPAIQPYLHPVTNATKQAELPGAFQSELEGGWGILWTNNCPRASEFERWDAMTSTEWEHRYVEAETMLQVVPAPAANSLTGNKVRERLHGVLAGMDRSVTDLPFSGRIQPSGEIYYNAPWDMLQAASPEVRKHITIQSGMCVKHLRRKGSRVTSVDVEDANKNVISLEAPAIFLAGGAIKTPRLLHASGITPAALGRGLSFHTLLFGQMLLDNELAAPVDVTDIDPRLWIPPTVESPWHLMLLRDTYPFAPAESIDNQHRLMEIQAFHSVDFQDENALLFDDNEDAAFHFALSQDDRDRMRLLVADVEHLAGQLGHWRRGCEPQWLPFDTAHLAGTCRMDVPGRDGVTDSFGRVHGFGNLFLTTVGLFPVPVAENPTLTAIALALRSCDHFIAGSAGSESIS